MISRSKQVKLMYIGGIIIASNHFSPHMPYDLMEQSQEEDFIFFRLRNRVKEE
jgi:hypothetical protein